MVQPFQISPVPAAISAVVSTLVFLPSLIVFLLMKCLATLLARLRFGRKATLLRGADSMATMREMWSPDSLLNMTLKVDGKVTVEQLRDRFRCR